MSYAVAAATPPQRQHFVALNTGHHFENANRDSVGDAGRGDDAGGGETDIAQEIDLRQLRHHTKNTLQRIIGLIGELPGLHDTPEGAQIARELEHRICLSATISNALFGLTDAPAPMAERLRQLAGPVVDMMRTPDQAIRVGVCVRCTCPVHLREPVMRTTHELVGNAVKHGMKGRANGRIAVRLVSQEAITTLTIIDDGWGFDGQPRDGEGLSLARSFASSHGGSLRLEGALGTVATLEELPNYTPFMREPENPNRIKRR